MNEEEKREYEELKSLLYDGTISQFGKRKLIDIIEKQQKEIEELKGINAIQKYRIEVIDPRELISKDKIKEKIEKIKENEEFYREQDNMYEFYGKIKILEELLGE